ncbi:protein of unknown function [Candidatus Filomicrobium marinum]|uniref:Uncharacterized protein n=1 Tax=Candidatus Filomicrobium marinum TaxID=1608628 RepID=A0A0D6JEV6_9HYPH|nr:protein of unknown function [Candidatus Filomicrobium marinum]
MPMARTIKTGATRANSMALAPLLLRVSDVKLRVASDTIFANKLNHAGPSGPLTKSINAQCCTNF